MAQEDLPLLDLFRQLRECGMPIGIGEYQLVLKAWQAGYGTADRAALERLCRTVWVKSPEESKIFEAQFNQLIRQLPNRETSVNQLIPSRLKWFKPRTLALMALGSNTFIIIVFLLNLPEDFNTSLGQLPVQIEVQSATFYDSASQLIPDSSAREENLRKQGQGVTSIMPMQPVPIPWWQQPWLALWGFLWLSSGAAWWWLKFRLSLDQHPPSEVHPGKPIALNRHIQDEVQLARLNHAVTTGEYLPVTRRQMKQSWRYLRRMVRQGPLTDLDVEATVQDIGRHGLLLAPVFRARRVNRAEVLLLIDQDGSMVPFHGLSQRLVDTALHGGRLTQASVYYFHNCPAGMLFHDPYYQTADSLDRVLQSVTTDYAGILLISDGGAAYGRWNPRRLELTEQFLKQMLRKVRHIAWLNPMPQERWVGTTAEAIAKQLPMFEFNRAGLEHAIGILRGQRGHHL